MSGKTIVTEPGTVMFGNLFHFGKKHLDILCHQNNSMQIKSSSGLPIFSGTRLWL